MLLRLIEKEKKRGCLAYPVKLGVVQSTTRSWSSSILKKEQFSHPDSLNCTIIIIFLPTNNRPKNLKCNNREKEEEGEEGKKCGNKEENLIISFDKAATKTGSELMSKARRNLRGCTSHCLPSSASLMCCVCGQEDGGKKNSSGKSQEEDKTCRRSRTERHVVLLPVNGKRASRSMINLGLPGLQSNWSRLAILLSAWCQVPAHRPQ